jgi:UPF0755 protein
MSKKVGRNLLVKFIVFSLTISLLIFITGAGFLWNYAFRSNVTIGDDLTADLYIPSGSDFNDVIDLLDDNQLIRNSNTFRWLALRKNFHNNIKPGRYRLVDGMNNNDLINMLRAGNQVPVNLVFISHRRIEDIAAVAGRQIEADSADIIDLADDLDFINSLGFDQYTLPALFIPNTYQVYWNTSAAQFYERMKTEYERFWNDTRELKRNSLGLSRIQVSTLASIVSEETVIAEEMPTIAGVYINRLKRGMRLQADPTVRYALGDFTVNRILRVHLDIDSPYNTYKHAGLPPGPISVPPVQAIDAVLDPEEHSYLYFSAREDFSGYHRFARTLTEHNRNARLYREALNKRRVFR